MPDQFDPNQAVEQTDPAAVTDVTQADSSPVEQQQVPEAVTPEQATPITSQEPIQAEEEPRVPYSRLKEVIEERNEERRRAQQLLELANRIQPQAAPVPQSDPWAGLVDHPDPATAQFYQKQRALFQHEANIAASQKVGALQPMLDAARQQLAGVTIAQFRKDNPEIKPGSVEEASIAERVGQGYTLEDAKRIVMYDVLVQKLNGKQTTQRAQQQQVRKQMIAEPSAGIPAQAGLPGPKASFRDQMRKNMAEMMGI